jgi:ectoine hydroxylase-related dioxygenase (phytanoyl-CoA dioxygenase family)
LGLIEMLSGETSSHTLRAIDPKALYAAGKRLDIRPSRFGQLTPSRPDEGMVKLRAKLAADGYLFLKGLLDTAEVNKFRAWVFEKLSDVGVVKPGTPFVEGVANPAGHDVVAADMRMADIVRSSHYEGFCAQPRLTAFIDAFIDGMSYLHKRKLMRFTVPHSAVSTAAHYDLVYLRGGTSRIVTAWIPIGDTSIADGGLIYLKGSHATGVKLEARFNEQSADLAPEERISAYNKHMTEGGWISKDLPAMAEQFDTQWLGADYEAGDVVLHSPYTIHASTNNVSPSGRMRLSTDIRFQNVSDAIDARWSNHWTPEDRL